MAGPGPTPSGHARRLTVTVRVGRQAFAFDLCTRPLTLDPGRTVDYYWMDATGFRITRGRRAADPVNVRSCLWHWWAATTASDRHRDPAQLDHLLLAAGYAAVSGSKAAHQVYRDARLASWAVAPTTEALADDVNARIRAAVAHRDRTRVGCELDVILAAPTPPPDAECEVMRQTLDGLLAHGRALVRETGAEGVRRFVARVDAWAAAVRRKGGQGWLRSFLNRFSCSCKAAFYTCAANAWVDLIPALRRDHGLDPVGERFMRVWHMQSHPDYGGVFRGQVLSLHPLSAFFMKDPALMAVAGRFFGTDAYARVFERGDADVPEYWDLVGAVLTAGHQYRQAFDRWAARRGATRGTARRLLEAYTADRNIRCPTCGGSPLVMHWTVANPGSAALVTFECGLCRRELPDVIDEDDFRSWCRDAT